MAGVGVEHDQPRAVLFDLDQPFPRLSEVLQMAPLFRMGAEVDREASIAISPNLGQGHGVALLGEQASADAGQPLTASTLTHQSPGVSSPPLSRSMWRSPKAILLPSLRQNLPLSNQPIVVPFSIATSIMRLIHASRSP